MKNNKNESKTVPERSFGKLLAQYITRKGLNQTEVAKLAKTTQPTISSLCTGRRQCGIGLATRFAEVLQLTQAERVKLLRYARKPRWKDNDHDLYDGEALLVNLVLSSIKAAGIDPRRIESATDIFVQDQKHPKTIIVLKDGRVFDVKIEVISRVAQVESFFPVPVHQEERAELVVEGAVERVVATQVDGKNGKDGEGQGVAGVAEVKAEPSVVVEEGTASPEATVNPPEKPLESLFAEQPPAPSSTKAEIEPPPVSDADAVTESTPDC